MPTTAPRSRFPTPTGVRWTHDGFEVQLYRMDAAFPDRMTLLAGAVGAASGFLGAATLAASAHADPAGITMMGAAGLVMTGLFAAGVVNRGARWWRSHTRVDVVLTSTHLRWSQHSVPLGKIEGLRLRGPRPWRLHIQTPTRSIDLPTGSEAHARWLGRQLAEQVVAFHGQAGSEDAVPEAIRQLSRKRSELSRERP